MDFCCCCIRDAIIEALPQEAQELLRSLGPMLCELYHSVLRVVISYSLLYNHLTNLAKVYKGHEKLLCKQTVLRCA